MSTPERLLVPVFWSYGMHPEKTCIHGDDEISRYGIFDIIHWFHQGFHLLLRENECSTLSITESCERAAKKLQSSP